MTSATDNRTTELLNCPFCGGEAKLSSDYSSERDKTRWSVWHECCEHKGESAGYGHALFPWFETPWYGTEAEAIEAWNTRHVETCELIRQEIKLPESLEGHDVEINVYECSVCGEPAFSNYNYCPNCGRRVTA